MPFMIGSLSRFGRELFRAGWFSGPDTDMNISANPTCSFIRRRRFAAFGIALLLLTWQAHADWLDNTHWRAPHPHDSELSALAVSGETVVVVGARGALSYGTRSSLSPLIHEGTQHFSSVAHGNGVWVAVAGTDTMGISTDGHEWTFREPPASLTDVIFDNGLFIAVGSEVFTSADGETWTQSSDTPWGGATWIFKTGDHYHAFSPGGWDGSRYGHTRVAVSDDELNWSQPETYPTILRLVTGAVYFGDALFVATGTNTRNASSYGKPALWQISEGQAPKELALSLPEQSPQWIGLIVLDETIYAVAESGMVVSSTNGLTWSVRSEPANLALTRIIPDQDGILAVGQIGHLRRWDETSGEWQDQFWALARKNFLNDVVVGDGIAFVVGDRFFARSLDGVSWQQVSGMGGQLWHRIEYIDNRFVALGAGGRIAHSTDGFHWNDMTVGTANLVDVAHGNGVWLVTGHFGGDSPTEWETHMSTDLESWSPLTLPTPLTEVEFGNGVFVGPGLISSDGVSWQLVANTLERGPGTLLRFDGTRFWGTTPTHITPHRIDTFVVSTDGITWESIDRDPVTATVVDHSFNPWTGELTTLHQSAAGHLSTSTDGAHFEFRDRLPESNFFTAMAHGFGTVLVVGDRGRIFQSDPTPLALPSRPANISSRSPNSGGTGTQIAGFVVPEGGEKRILVRGVGPGLAGFGVTDALEKPVLTLYDAGNTIIATNDDWQDGENEAELSAAFEAVGAFAFEDGSGDAALLIDLPSGSYTAQISGGAGTSLAEVYAVETDGMNPAPLLNISTRAISAPDDTKLIGGIVISGETSQRILVRAVGPGLVPLGVEAEQVMTDPVVDVLRNGNLVTTIEPWSQATNQTEIESVADSVGAFEIEADSLDAAGVLGLSPANYTFQVRSVSGETGVVILEIYRVPSE